MTQKICFRKFSPILFFLSSLGLPLEAAFFQEQYHGWFTHEQQEEEIAGVEEIEALAIPGFEKTKLVKQKTEESLNEAIWEPSSKNIERFLSYQNALIRRSSNYSKQSQLFHLNHPEYSFAPEVASSQYGVSLEKNVARADKNHKLEMLAKSHGLLFVYQGMDPLSPFFAKVVQSLSERYQFYIFAISVDEQLLDREFFRFPHLDRSLATKLDAKFFPSLYLVDAKNETYLPVAHSVESLDVIEENILLQSQNQEEKK